MSLLERRVIADTLNVLLRAKVSDAEKLKNIKILADQLPRRGWPRIKKGAK